MSGLFLPSQEGHTKTAREKADNSESAEVSQGPKASISPSRATGIACWLQRRTRDGKVASLNLAGAAG